MRALKVTAALFMTSYIVACSPVKFDAVSEAPCGVSGVACVTQCQGPDCINSMTVSKTVGRGLVDILIINDNSGSMSPEQAKMSARFPTFIQSLGSVNYRIAMTTTDITSSLSQTHSDTNTPPPEVNPTKAGYIQDGNLVTFGNGKKYLEGADGVSSPSNQSHFATAVQRQETLTCEQSGYTNCPSSDERGIFAANMVIEKNEFIRPTSHLAIVILSDEDERGISSQNSVKNSNDALLIQSYKLEKYDKAQGLVDRVKARFPGKSLSVHPIIVKPGDSACLNSQTIPSQNLRGVEGWSYQALQQIAGGTMGSICDNDYGTTLSQIGNYVQKESISLPFTCRPIDDDFTVTFTPQPAGNVQVEADFAKMTLKVIDQLPADTKVTLTYDCLK